ncbi:MAG TPA: hypothetical protein VK163_11310, partial [Opitutaceae bacterium]|nr:hypothetical protein [Opitutaceae bacterium]
RSAAGPATAATTRPARGQPGERLVADSAPRRPNRHPAATAGPRSSRPASATGAARSAAIPAPAELRLHRGHQTGAATAAGSRAEAARRPQTAALAALP